MLVFVVECVHILEERLGLGQDGRQASQSQNNQSNNDNQVHKGKKNPLGFIVDLFRPKKVKSNHREISDESEVMFTETTDGGNKQHADNLSKNATTSNSDADKEESPAAQLMTTTPKKQQEEEMLKSMEKLQISREDNPALKKYSDNSHQLGKIRTSHSQNIPLGGGKKVLPPAMNSPDSKLDHSFLIRSPPPSRSSKKPAAAHVVSGWGTSEHNRLQLEQDAAQILAIQRGPSQPVTPLSMSRPLDSPLTPRVCMTFIILGVTFIVSVEAMTSIISGETMTSIIYYYYLHSHRGNCGLHYLWRSYDFHYHGEKL